MIHFERLECACVNSATFNQQQQKKATVTACSTLPSDQSLEGSSKLLCLKNSNLKKLSLHSSYPQSFEIQAEPANALSVPTWAIHISSVLEWVTAMVGLWGLYCMMDGSEENGLYLPPAQNLFLKYAEVTGNPLWKGMTWGMLPSLGSAMSACTFHFFYTAPSLESLVAFRVKNVLRSRWHVLGWRIFNSLLMTRRWWRWLATSLVELLRIDCTKVQRIVKSFRIVSLCFRNRNTVGLMIVEELKILVWFETAATFFQTTEMVVALWFCALSTGKRASAL